MLVAPVTQEAAALRGLLGVGLYRPHQPGLKLWLVFAVPQEYGQYLTGLQMSYRFTLEQLRMKSPVVPVPGLILAAAVYKSLHKMYFYIYVYRYLDIFNIVSLAVVRNIS